MLKKKLKQVFNLFLKTFHLSTQIQGMKLCFRNDVNCPYNYRANDCMILLCKLFFFLDDALHFTMNPTKGHSNWQISGFYPQNTSIADIEFLQG